MTPLLVNDPHAPTRFELEATRDRLESALTAIRDLLLLVRDDANSQRVLAIAASALEFKPDWD